jgi:KipI family sensor histidine kinase inhibitor
MIFDRPRFAVLSGNILHVEVGDEISLPCSAKVHGLFAALSGLQGVDEVTPAYASLAGRVDVESTKMATAIKAVERAWSSPSKGEPGGRLVKVPVCYEGEFAPDLDGLAKRAGLTKELVVALHSSKEYTCMMLGFAPGFVYLDDVDPKIRMERLEAPRTKVPAGSVGIAGKQTGIYGLEAPGGWRLIGRTPLTMFNPVASPPTPVGPGDHVRFEPISADEFKFVKKASVPPPPSPAGSQVLEVEQPGLFASVQDMGRSAFRHLGVPSSGGLDVLSQLQSNYAVGNPGDYPVMEVIGGFFKAKALAEVVVAVTGCECDLSVGGEPVDRYSALLLKEGDELAIGKTKGLLNYMSVAGRLAASSVMGSCSTYHKGGFGGYSGRALKAGDVLGVERLSEHVLMRNVAASDRVSVDGSPVKAVRSPLLESRKAVEDALFDREYEVSEASDRTGYRLKCSERLPGASGNVLSYPTYPGYVQIPLDGSPIVLQKDCPTTGGYELAAVILPSETGRFSQLRPGSKVKFEEVGEETASKDVKKFIRLLKRYASGNLQL